MPKFSAALKVKAKRNGIVFIEGIYKGPFGVAGSRHGRVAAVRRCGGAAVRRCDAA
jgi:hypothetical protein